MSSPTSEPPEPADSGPDADADADTVAATAARLRLALVRLGRVVRQASATAGADGDLTPTLLSALGTLEARGRMTLGDLAGAEGVQPPTMTKVVARLEERGLIDRETDPADRRFSRVGLTERGRQVVLDSRARRDAWMADRLRHLNDAELAALVAAVPVLEKLGVAP